MIVIHHLAILVANTTAFGLHQGIAGFITSTDITVDACPAFVAFACAIGSHRPIFSTCERTTYYWRQLVRFGSGEFDRLTWF
jgi:hypothetical protein